MGGSCSRLPADQIHQPQVRLCKPTAKAENRQLVSVHRSRTALACGGMDAVSMSPYFLSTPRPEALFSPLLPVLPPPFPFLSPLTLLLSLPPSFSLLSIIIQLEDTVRLSYSSRQYRQLDLSSVEQQSALYVAHAPLLLLTFASSQPHSRNTSSVP